MCAYPRREEEDREMAAARRASLAMRRQEERGAVQERSAPKHSREERTERTEPEEPRHRTGHIKPTSKPPGKKGNVKNYTYIMCCQRCVTPKIVLLHHGIPVI